MPRNLRIVQIDIARTMALVAMAIFHFTFDLEAFGFVAAGTISSTPWILFARTIAGSFIFLSGLSLVLGTLDAHINPKKTIKRLALIGAAAIAVSVGTYFAMGYAYVRFGILHHMFVATLLGLALLRLPTLALGALGTAVLLLPYLVEWPMLSGTGWLWLARTSPMPPMVDYVPILPWFGVFLFGMVAARLFGRVVGWEKLSTRDTTVVQALSWPGRHSLLIYLLHQPILFSAVYAARYFLG